ncbi:MAG: hypothetical protein WC596_02340 [Candidatus Shapirobacteria bacterium]
MVKLLDAVRDLFFPEDTPIKICDMLDCRQLATGQVSFFPIPLLGIESSLLPSCGHYCEDHGRMVTARCSHLIASTTWSDSLPQ